MALIYLQMRLRCVKSFIILLSVLTTGSHVVYIDHLWTRWSESLLCRMAASFRQSAGEAKFWKKPVTFRYFLYFNMIAWVKYISETTVALKYRQLLHFGSILLLRIVSIYIDFAIYRHVQFLLAMWRGKNYFLLHKMHTVMRYICK